MAKKSSCGTGSVNKKVINKVGKSSSDYVLEKSKLNNLFKSIRGKSAAVVSASTSSTSRQPASNKSASISRTSKSKDGYSEVSVGVSVRKRTEDNLPIYTVEELNIDKYCEVVSNRQVKQGRGSASLQVEYIEFPSRKPMTLNLPIGAKVDKIDLEKQGALVQYLDSDARELVVSDHNFEEKRIPALIVGDGAKLLEAGDEIQLFYHNETIVKVSLPNTITSRLK
ncbi:uncharacterized protein BXIN_0272 [Babesia sp. Xinjiang]|uniref:uncharacterized protein n=1 Tax=Babesia sp. Xinjiang TaxID=462227 RepID=UPI000A2415E4|nr:uncharacterized protein BXIN_0272 [Babesia sp. Xinjiang]ORM39685.1 hypothetical protein BXIN_0272 [Babesia sp. Xinjiang]